MEEAFQKLSGVKSVVSGYTGGNNSNPTYEAVSGGTTGHAEAIEITYDPKVISYEKLLEIFWQNIDPTVENRQFCDEGSQYRAEIFVLDELQTQMAKASKERLEKKFSKIFTKITPAGPFYAAEDYHQDYFLKNPIRYTTYKYSCGRAARLKEVWKGK